MQGLLGRHGWDARVDIRWPIKGECSIEDTEYYLRDTQEIIDGSSRKGLFCVFCCGLVYSLFVTLVEPEEGTTNPSTDGLHGVEFGKKQNKTQTPKNPKPPVINFINWMSMTPNVMLCYEI